MGLRYRKSINIGPFRINLSKSGVGYSFGGKHLRVTKKATGGYRATTTLPGTGLSYAKDMNGKELTALGGSILKYVAGGLAAVLLFVGVLVGCVARDDAAEDTFADTPDVQQTELVEQEEVLGRVEDTADVSNDTTQAVDPKPVADLKPDTASDAAPVSKQEPVVEQTPESRAEITPVDSTQTAPATAVEPKVEQESEPAPQVEEKKVYRTKSGKRYHYDDNCNGGTYYETTLNKALAAGLTPCQKCVG